MNAQALCVSYSKPTHSGTSFPPWWANRLAPILSPTHGSANSGCVCKCDEDISDEAEDSSDNDTEHGAALHANDMMEYPRKDVMGRTVTAIVTTIAIVITITTWCPPSICSLWKPAAKIKCENSHTTEKLHLIAVHAIILTTSNRETTTKARTIMEVNPELNKHANFTYRTHIRDSCDDKFISST